MRKFLLAQEFALTFCWVKLLGMGGWRSAGIWRQSIWHQIACYAPYILNWM